MASPKSEVNFDAGGRPAYCAHIVIRHSCKHARPSRLHIPDRQTRYCYVEKEIAIMILPTPDRQFDRELNPRLFRIARGGTDDFALQMHMGHGGITSFVILQSCQVLASVRLDLGSWNTSSSDSRPWEKLQIHGSRR